MIIVPDMQKWLILMTHRLGVFSYKQTSFPVYVMVP